MVGAISLVGSLALSSYQQNKQERAQKQKYDASQTDRLTNLPATSAPRELVMGRVRKGGNVFFRGSAGQFKQLFAVCITLAAHEIDGVERIFFNGDPVDVDVDGFVTTAPWGRYLTLSATEYPTAAVTTLSHAPYGPSLKVIAVPSNLSVDNLPTGAGYELDGTALTITNFDPAYSYQVSYQYLQFASVANVRWHLGAPGQAADARLQGLFPGVWTAAHRADNVAYLACDFVYDETAMPTGLPVVSAQIRGAKIFDPRLGVTQFTETPALMMRHVALHPQFGKRTSMTAAEDARIAAAASACEAGISYTGADFVAVYRAGIVIPFGSAPRDALDDLAQAMGGQWAYASGELFVRAGVYQLPVMNLSDADLAVVNRSNDGTVAQSSITISTHKARADKINSISARIWDQAAGYIETPITPFTPNDYVVADGAVLPQELPMPAVFYAPQAYAICGIILRDGRDPLTVALPFKLTAYPLELFDGVTLTLARYGWVSKEFWILGRTFRPDGVLQLTLKETSFAIFAFGAAYLPQGYASNSTLPKPWEIYPPTITGISSGEDELIVQSDGTITDAVRVTWAPIQDASVLNGGSVEIVYLLPLATEWRSVIVPGGQTQALIVDGIYDGAIISIRARARNSLAVSDWGLQLWHTVIGKTEPPPNIDSLSIAGSILSWTMPRRVPDLAGFVFRFHYGNNLDWNSAAPLHTGVLTQSPCDLVTRPGGVVTIMGKAIDTTGNMSPASANVVMNLGDAPIANIVEQWNFGALGWPFASGEQSGWTLVGGLPSADALDAFYGTDDQSFYGEDTDSVYKPSAYGQMVFVTEEISITQALAGSLMTLASETEGTDLRIEYRLSGPGSFYGPDNASFYASDSSAPFYGPAGPWQPWPGQAIAANDAYEFRVTIGAGVQRGVLDELVLTIDAPDLEESLADLPVVAFGTVIPYSKPFTSIKTVQATLQANGSGAETVEIDKSVPLHPRISAFNSSHVSVSGATADIVIRGY